MRKLLPILLLFVCFAMNAQDTVISDPPKIAWTKEDIQLDKDSISKKGFTPNFQEKYTSEEFIYTEKPIEKTFWDLFIEWLSRILQNLFDLGGDEAQSATDIFLKVLAAIVLIVVIYLIVKAILNKEGQWVFGRSSAGKILRATDIEKNLQVVNFEKLVAQTIAAGDKRLAIRYYYLWLLKKFSERGIITWDIEKTNSDYLREIKDEQYKSQFAYLSYLYNYIWYGEFEPDDPAFQKAVNAFSKTIHSV